MQSTQDSEQPGRTPKRPYELTDAARARFWNEGYMVVPSVFQDTAIDAAKASLLDEVRKENRLDAAAPPLGSQTLARQAAVYDAARGLLFSDEVVGIAESLLGHQPVYFGDSSVNFGPGYTGWHKDNRVSDRKDGSAPDWQGAYDLIRIGIYLQDCARFSGGLLVRAGSHLNAPRMPAWAKSGGGSLGALTRRLVAFRSRFNGKARFVDSDKGDVVVWTLRTTHAGHAVRLKGMPNLVLDPRIQPMLPRFFQVPQDGYRVAVFATFARPGAHYDRYKQYLAGRDYFANRPRDDVARFMHPRVIVDKIRRS